MTDFDLTVTIASWNTRERLRECLNSLLALSDEARTQIIVFDNASTDGSPEMVRQCFPQVTLIASERNLGFGSAHNRAMAAGSGRYFMALNPDAIVKPGTLSGLVAFADAHPRAGIVGPRIVNPDGTLQYSCRRFPTIQAALFRNTLLGKLFPKNRFTGDYLMRDWAHDEPRLVDWVSGAAMMVRAEMRAEIGGFDERFFMYCEDVDWCLRAHQAGWEVWYAPVGEVVHVIGSSTDQVANQMIRMFHHSMWLYYKKHEVEKVSPLLRPLVPLGLWVRGSLFIAKNRLDAFVRWLRR